MSLATLKGKVEQLIDKADSKGVILSGFEGDYALPTVADVRSVPKPDTKYVATFMCLFQNYSVTATNGYFVSLREVYLPDWTTHLGFNMFYNCGALTIIHGDLSNVKGIMGSTFFNCVSLLEIPYMPNLEDLRGNNFYGCTQFKQFTFYKPLKYMEVSAFRGSVFENITIPEGWNINTYFHHCQNLTQESLHAIIENLADMTGQTAPTFQIGETNIAKLDEEHITMLETKNWNYL